MAQLRKTWFSFRALLITCLVIKGGHSQLIGQCMPRIQERLEVVWREFESRCRAPPTYGTYGPHRPGRWFPPPSLYGLTPIANQQPTYGYGYGSQMPLRPTSAFLNPETHLTPAESVYLEYYGVDTPSGMWSQPRSRSGYLRGAILSPYQQQGQYPAGGINNGYPPTAFFAPGTKAVHWQGALTRVQAILADSRQQIFGGPGRLPPPPPDAMLMASKVARIGIATLPNLCNAAELQRFKIAVREHLAYHLPNLRNYVERQNYCASIMGFMLGVGRLEIEQVLQNFTT